MYMIMQFNEINFDFIDDLCYRLVINSINKIYIEKCFFTYL